MSEFSSAVYEPSDPEMPLVAVILADGEVRMAFTVSSVAEGERMIRLELRGLKERAEAADAKKTEAAGTE